MEGKGPAADVDAFIAAVPDEQKRADSRTLVELMRRITSEEPQLWGTIIGFGRYHYRYESGREGDDALASFSPRKGAITVYLTGTYLPEQGDARDALLARLGKHTIGKACLYIKRLSDLDMGVLEELIRMSVEALRTHYPATGRR